MSSHNLNDTAVVDIDGTLLRADNTIDAAVLAWINGLRAKGINCILWSIRGTDYARAIAQQHNITHLFTAIIGKPCTIVDDRGWQWARYSRAIHPMQLRLKYATLSTMDDTETVNPQK